MPSLRVSRATDTTADVLTHWEAGRQQERATDNTKLCVAMIAKSTTHCSTLCHTHSLDLLVAPWALLAVTCMKRYSMKMILVCKLPACILTPEHELCTLLLWASNLCIQLKRPHQLPASFTGFAEPTFSAIAWA